MSAAKLLSKSSHIVPGKIKISELFFEVPKDHSKPTDGSTLRLFARSMEKVEKPVDSTKDEGAEKPWLAYLQGGPGMGCQPPQNSSWAKIVLEKGYRMLFLDQRGTGLSTTVTAQTLARQGGPKEQVAYLKHFRADSIVQDCEAIRKVLTKDLPPAKQKWSILGQSFGGFCAVNYLSRFPSSLHEVFLSGGLPPLVNQPDIVYTALLSKVAERSRIFYEKYPEDVQRVKDIVDYLSTNNVKTPSGSKVTPMRLRQLGLLFGYHGGLDTAHEMLLRFWNDLETFSSLTRPTLAAFDDLFFFNTGVLYALLHEPLYLQKNAAANWSAERMKAQRPEFNRPLEKNSKDPILFTAEMIFREMYEDYDELVPLRETAELLAKETEWPELYDEGQLGRNEVPVYSATYYDDLYVNFVFAQETAGKIRGCRQWITNAVYHDAIGARSEEVIKALFTLRDDVID